MTAVGRADAHVCVPQVKLSGRQEVGLNLDALVRKSDFDSWNNRVSLKP